MAEPLDSFLARLDQVRTGGSGWTARCPAHDDRHNSLSVSEGDDGRVLVYCHTGCSIDEIVAALGLELSDLFAGAPTHGPVDPPDSTATVQHPGGCTLQAYAYAKRLPVDFLRGLGMSDITYSGAPAVRIPYLDESGDETAVRIRVALDGEDRFRWKKKARLQLYGLNRLADARERAYVVVVEGESDVHTLWQHGYPALGVPGASLWSESRDAPHLEGLDSIYVVIEPDRGGEAMLFWIRESSVRDRVRLVRLDGSKDISELYLASPEHFREHLEQMLQGAVHWSEHETVERELQRTTAWGLCAKLASAQDILALLEAELDKAGLVGEARTAKLIYLALTSRLLNRPVSLALKGPSAGGKSYTLQRVLELFPPRVFYALTAMSDRALAYGTEPLAHRFLIIYEAAGVEGDFASYLLRSLLSEGRLRYETVEKTPTGLQARVVERAGPTGLIVTTTAISLHPENETRLLSIPVADTPEQTRRILLALAEGEHELNTEPWQALQTFLEAGPAKVVIPFAIPLAELVPPVATRLRRDFSLLLSLIKAHALLHQCTRAHDEDGAVIATTSDYAAVRELIHDLVAESAETSVAQTVRETVEAVRRLTTDAPEGVSLAAVAKELGGLDKSTVSRRVAAAKKHNYVKNLEERRGRPARLVLGDPLPAEREILPTPEALAAASSGERCTVAPKDGGEPAPPATTDDTDADQEMERIRQKFPDLFEDKL